MADIVLKNGWNKETTYHGVTSVSFPTPEEGVIATFYENRNEGGGDGGLTIQVDWEQNDASAPDYIKNRPFYSYYPPIIEEYKASLEMNYSTGLYEVSTNFVFELGKNYVINWGNEKWLCSAKSGEEGVLYIGNTAILTGDEINELEPPFVGKFLVGSETSVFYSKAGGGISLGFYEEEIVHKMDPKYLPDEVADMARVDWNAEEGEPGYIQNKPDYLDKEDIINPSQLQEELEKIQQNVQSDWNAVAPSLAAIKNKPTDLANEKFVQDEIAKVQQNVQSDWNAAEPSLAAIKNKPNNLATTPYVTSEINKITKALEGYVKNEDFTKQFEDSQADWNIEDETNLAAIKNKPFGIHPDFLNGTYQPSDFIETIDENNLTVYELRSGKTLTSYQTCIVTWNETTYTCTPGVNVSGREFQLSLDGAIILSTKPTTPKTVVLRLADNIYRIDKKFLPTSEIVAGYATQKYVDNKVSEIPQPDWNATTGKGAILNKPEIKTPVQSNWLTKDPSDLSYIMNKPTIPDAQVNSDWKATSGKAMILNKPTIPDPQVQANWAQTDSAKIDFIKNKPDHFADWSQIDPNAPDFVRGKPQFFSDWNATTGTNRIENMPSAFRHTQKEAGAEEFIVDTATGWERRPANKLTMTVTFDDETVKIYSIVGSEVVE